MKNLYIVGAGGFGRELASMLEDIKKLRSPDWQIAGFLDDTPDPLKGKPCNFGVAGSIVDFSPGPEDILVMGIADPAAKRKLVPLLKNRGARFESIIHPYAYLGRHNHIGEGVVIHGGFSMSVNCSIGNYATLLPSGIGHDVQLGDFCTISARCNLMGRVSIGNGVFMGGNVAVAPGVRIGEDAYVCVGSVLINNVSPGAKVLGNPAREIG